MMPIHGFFSCMTAGAIGNMHDFPMIPVICTTKGNCAIISLKDAWFWGNKDGWKKRIKIVLLPHEPMLNFSELLNLSAI